MAVNMCQPHRARAQNCKALPDRLLISALFAAALAQPTAETSDHGRGQQECDDHAHADEQIGENYSGAAVDGHDARRRFASMPLYGQWSGSPRRFNALRCFNVRLDSPAPGAIYMPIMLFRNARPPRMDSTRPHVKTRSIARPNVGYEHFVMKEEEHHEERSGSDRRDKDSRKARHN